MKRTPGPPPAQEKPRQPGGIRAVFLAIVVHAAFFALIVFGVTWQSRQQAPLQAELWKELPPAPKSKTPEPEPPKPEPPAPEPPKPEPPKPEPPKPEPPKPEVRKPEPPKPDPAIALREKKEREKKERLEKLEREKKKKEEDAAKKKKDDDARTKKEDEAKRKEDERARREAERAREETARARQSEIDRYRAAIQQKIRSRANVPDTVIGNPEVTVLIKLLPGGDVLDIAITKRSGNPTYDAAIERGIRSASPLPVPAANSELFPLFRELSLNIRHER